MKGTTGGPAENTAARYFLDAPSPSGGLRGLTGVHGGRLPRRRLYSPAGQVIKRRRLALRDALSYLHDPLDIPVPAGVLEELRATHLFVSERADHRILTSEHRLLGRLPMIWLYHKSSARSPWSMVAGFPTSLQYELDADYLWQVLV